METGSRGLRRQPRILRVRRLSPRAENCPYFRGFACQAEVATHFAKVYSAPDYLRHCTMIKSAAAGSCEVGELEADVSRTRPKLCAVPWP
jgi:hypothetical protein